MMNRELKSLHAQFRRAQAEEKRALRKCERNSRRRCHEASRRDSEILATAYTAAAKALDTVASLLVTHVDAHMVETAADLGMSTGTLETALERGRQGAAGSDTDLACMICRNLDAACANAKDAAAAAPLPTWDGTATGLRRILRGASAEWIALGLHHYSRGKLATVARAMPLDSTVSIHVGPHSLRFTYRGGRGTITLYAQTGGSLPEGATVQTLDLVPADQAGHHIGRNGS